MYIFIHIYIYIYIYTYLSTCISTTADPKSHTLNPHSESRTS